MLELEGSNFPVILDVWSQVVERGAGQGCAATPTDDVGDLILKMEDNLLKNLTSGTGVGATSWVCKYMLYDYFQIFSVADLGCLSRIQDQKDSGSRI